MVFLEMGAVLVAVAVLAGHLYNLYQTDKADSDQLLHHAALVVVVDGEPLVDNGPPSPILIQ
jgi:hypothetical protein